MSGTTVDWYACLKHEWLDVESQCGRGVRCTKCGCHGERDPNTNEVYWPAT